MHKRLLFILPLAFLTVADAQLSESYKELRGHILGRRHWDMDTVPYISIYRKGELNYLYPVYQSTLYQDRLLATGDSKAYYDNLSQALSFTGDYATALALEQPAFDRIDDSTRQLAEKAANAAKEVSYADAKTYLLAHTGNSRVVMINEAHNKPLHRAFTASLLQELYRQGFRYLAMEMLNPYPNASLKRLNMLTGHYSCEPVAGELVRKALEIGYTLVPYEDTLAGHSAKEREYQQAWNLGQVLKKDSTAKILVHAGYGHIQKSSVTDDWIPMAAYFKLITGITPLTIDQTLMTEGSTTAYGQWLYHAWMRIKPSPSAVVPLLGNQPFDPQEQNLFDITVIHPPTTYVNGRPSWMNMDNWKKETPIAPAYQYLFLVQAYYEGEYSEKTVGRMVPADQTYITAPNGYLYLYLRQGKYKLVFRDKEYKVLGTKDLTVN